ncbi:hypothetical protein M9H77_12464 [Catharanthus roseus]|uniref:Uncharacterized protein n=1 Tax=Catharanthus roseus TaxID=4058 RepID=A0ACC0BHH3_CATRO|nr:hypothetical protein M9H77_12464 [Catharanthus roseus]
MIAHVEDALKSKIKELHGQGKLSKLFTMCSIVKEKSREQLGTAPTADDRSYPTVAGSSQDGFCLTALLGENFSKIFNRGSSIKGCDLGKHLDPIQQSKEDSSHNFSFSRCKMIFDIKDNDGNTDNGMVSCMEDALKNKLEEFEGLGKASKLF